MAHSENNKPFWKAIGFMAIGAIALYQLIKGEEVLIYPTNNINYYKLL